MVTPGLKTPYDHLRLVIVWVSGTFVRRCTTSQPSGGGGGGGGGAPKTPWRFLVMVKNLAVIPGNVGYREINVRRRGYSCDI